MLLLYAAISVYTFFKNSEMPGILSKHSWLLDHLLYQMYQKWLIEITSFHFDQKFWNTILAAPSTLSFKLSFKVWWPPSCGLFSLPFTGLKIVETTPKFLWTTSKKPFKQFFLKKEGKRIQLAPAATAPIKRRVQSNW